MKEIYQCPEYLKSHPLYGYYSCDLASLAEKDYSGKGYFKGKEIPSIDLDEYERHTRQSNDCTSDGVIGIADVVDSRMTNRRLLLVELRMNYENQKNLDFSNIKRKYAHSSEILRHYDSDIRIDSEFALIFSERIEPKAKRWIKSWGRETSKRESANWISYTPESFCNHINYGQTLPLIPSAETIAVVERLCLQNELCFEELLVLAEKINNYWTKLKHRHLLIDMQYLSDRMLSYISKVTFPCGEEGAWCQLLKEELENMIHI